MVRPVEGGLMNSLLPAQAAAQAKPAKPAAGQLMRNWLGIRLSALRFHSQSARIALVISKSHIHID
jgi:hypothetical protein